MLSAWAARSQPARAESTPKRCPALSAPLPCSVCLEVIKLAIDGKQSILNNQYTSVTLVFLECSEQVTLTRGPGTRVVQSFTPLPTAIAARALQHYCSQDLQRQIWQLHKDYAKGDRSITEESFFHRLVLRRLSAHAEGVVRSSAKTSWRRNRVRN